jgi:hypothetical protein
VTAAIDAREQQATPIRGGTMKHLLLAATAAICLAGVAMGSTLAERVGGAGPPGEEGATPTAASARGHVYAPDAAHTSPRPAPPSAGEFGVAFVETTNSYAREHHDSARISDPHCVQASAGHYMCAYTVTGRGPHPTCHLMQARWTPDETSTITVTLAGGTGRCGTLREALDSLE